MESALLHTEATLRHLQERTNEIRLEGPDAKAPIRHPDSLLFSKEFFDELVDREMRRARVADLPQVFDGQLHASAGLATHSPDDPPASSESIVRRAFLALYESRVHHGLRQPTALALYESPLDHGLRKPDADANQSTGKPSQPR